VGNGAEEESRLLFGETIPLWEDSSVGDNVRQIHIKSVETLTIPDDSDWAGWRYL